ncbi:MAG: hypothetical protein JW829_07515 [Pirellulales bacterium]|nr:hypothetical protein [Pirellulales bacterium]
MSFIALVTHSLRLLSWSRFTYLVFAIAVCCWMAAAVPAATLDIVTIEEDWELAVQDPDPNSASPQIACILAPFGHVHGHYAVFELNHRTQPEFTSGGMQLQLWNGEALVAHGNFPNPDLLNSPTETILWTQRMHLEGGQLRMEIINGSSTSWGSFGGQGYLFHTIQTDAGNLNSYNPSIVVEKSGISYAANRVGHLVLKEIRFIARTGEVFTDSTSRVVHGD